jgi:hypothetical protein
MREFAKSFFSYSLAATLFGFRQAGAVLDAIVSDDAASRAGQAFDSLTEETTHHLGDGLKAIFRAADNVQRGVVEITFGFLTPNGQTRPDPTPSTDSEAYTSSSEPRLWTDLAPTLVDGRRH